MKKKTSAHFILYVHDQMKATAFYHAALGQEPSLDVPGMTEFALGSATVLGLMPEAGIKKLLGDKLPDPESTRGVPRAEIYLHVEQPGLFHDRAIKAGAKELSPLSERSWGDEAAYSLDPDGHVVAFARSLSSEIVYQISDPLESDTPLFQSVLELDGKIFGVDHAAGLGTELSRKHHPTLFVATSKDKVVGYKLGYERKPNHYYSWLGGVSADHQRHGIATTLMKMQHDWCRANGYVAIRTQTKNKWRNMILLNIRSGYHIIGSFTDDTGEPKIMLEKNLVEKGC